MRVCSAAEAAEDYDRNKNDKPYVIICESVSETTAHVDFLLPF